MGARVFILVLLFSLQVVNYIDRVALSVAAKDISSEYSLSPIQVGYLFSSFLWTYTLLLLPCGIIIDRFGAKVISSTGVAIWSAATMLTAATWNFTSILLCRLGLGIGEATTVPAASRIVREWVPAGERATALATFSAGTFAGPAVGALVVGTIQQSYGWRTAFVAVGLLSLAWLIVYALVYKRPEDARWLPEAERRKILNERGAVPAVAGGGRGQGIIMALLSAPAMWGMAITHAVVVYANYLLLFWLPSYLQVTRGLSVGTTGLFTAFPYAVAAPLSILIGLVSDRMLSREGVFRGGRRTAIAIMVVVAAVVLLVPFISNIWLLVGVFTVTLTAIASALAMNTALVSDLLPDGAHIGTATSMIVLAGNLLGLLAPIITGYVVSASGSYDWAFGIAGLLLLAGAVATLTMTRQLISVDQATCRSAMAGRLTHRQPCPASDQHQDVKRRTQDAERRRI